MTRAAKILQHDVFFDAWWDSSPSNYVYFVIYLFFFVNYIMDKHITKWHISVSFFPYLFEIKKKTAA